LRNEENSKWFRSKTRISKDGTTDACVSAENGELEPTIVTREHLLNGKPTRFGVSTESSSLDFSSGRRRHKEKKGNQKKGEKVKWGE
jgi:hypothetical protein